MGRSTDGRWTRNCEVCGREFQQRKPAQRTCSPACRAKLPHRTGGLRAKPGLEPRQCQNPECGKTYQPVRDNQVACSRACLLKTASYRTAQQRHDAQPSRRARQNELRRLDTAPDVERRRFINLRNNLRRVGIEISPAQFEQFLAGRAQECGICGRPVSGKSAHIDHDHQTGQLRDWLCGTCNQGLGLFKDDPVLLLAAAEYIQRHRAVAAVLVVDQAGDIPSPGS